MNTHTIFYDDGSQEEVDLAKEMEDNIEWYGQFASLPVVRNDMLFCFPV